jgi:YfiH family protein
MRVYLPDWPAPEGVRSLVTTRSCGNLATHAEPQEAAIENRARLRRAFELPAEPVWMKQVHGNRVIAADRREEATPEADAAHGTVAGLPLVVMVADCVPILLTTRSGDEIAAVHAGWRGLACGVIESAVAAFENKDVIAWIGPHIGPCHYEVDAAVRDRFDSAAAFQPGRDREHWMMNLETIASGQLREAGVPAIYRSGVCTFCDERFYSFRQDPHCGRFGVMIWRSAGQAMPR